MQPEPPSAHHDLLLLADLVGAIAKRSARGTSEAEDVVQQTWLAAVRRPPRHDSSLRGWLVRVTRSQAAGLARRELRWRDAPRMLASPEPPATPLEELERSSTHEQLRRAVARLDDKYRQAIQLRFFEGLTPPQIAVRAGISLENVRTRLKRGLQRLRREYGVTLPARSTVVAGTTRASTLT